MSSRQEQKERRRREREERMKREKQAEQRKQLGQIVGGVAIVAAIVVALVLVVSGSGGDSTTGAAVQDEAPGGTAIPAVNRPGFTSNLTAAVEKARCAYTDEFEDEGADHVEGPLTPTDFETNPPTSGNHNPVPAADGYYPRGQTPPIANHVHTLEHGRIIFQYSPRLSEADERKMRTLYNEDIAGAGGRYHAVLMQNNTNMTYLVAATAWRSSLRCNQVNEFTWDAMRAFYREKLDQGPESVP